MGDGGVEAQYTRGDLHAAILAGLKASGKDSDHLMPEDLAPVEEFHTLGRLATLSLAQAAAIGPEDHVLDAGSGIGGPSRTLANAFGCRVTGVDLTAEFCAIAEDLNARTGLLGLVDVVHGDILDLPFDPGTFSVAWTQHVAMNIEDKAGLYRELRRVLRRGGRLAFFDAVAGDNQPIHVPVPWADTAAVSFLASPDEIRAQVEAAGFEVRSWDDLTPQSLAFWQGASRGMGPGGPPPLGVHLLMADLPAKIASMVRNLEEDRIRFLRCVAHAV